MEKDAASQINAEHGEQKDERWVSLAKQVSLEQDHNKLHSLVNELCRELDRSKRYRAA